MILSRVKQVYTYLFCKYDEKNNLLVKEILNSEEFEIFNKMSRYEKIHSFNLLKLILENHPNLSYEKLKNINLNVGTLAKHHHDKYYDENMKIFQQLDDK